LLRGSEDTKSTKGHEEHEDKNIRKSIAFDELSRKVIGLAIEVHRELGPGLLENTYKQCLTYELNEAKIQFNTEVELAVRYKDICIPSAYRIDL
jgi:hypothetical protein